MMEEAGVFTVHRFPRATHTKKQKVVGGRIRPTVSTITVMTGCPNPCRG